MSVSMAAQYRRFRSSASFSIPTRMATVVRDVHAGDYLYYSATFINMAEEPVDYGDQHLVHIQQSCPATSEPVLSYGPTCKGTIEFGGVATHYYRVLVPANNNLIGFNPYAFEIGAWVCDDGVPLAETDRSCFDITLLPAWGPPPLLKDFGGFVIEEIDAPPAFAR